MRHFLRRPPPGPVPVLARGVPAATVAGPLIVGAGRPQRRLPGDRGAATAAVPLPTVTVRAQEEDLRALPAPADHEPQRLHASLAPAPGGVDARRDSCDDEHGRHASLALRPEGSEVTAPGPRSFRTSGRVLYRSRSRCGNDSAQTTLDTRIRFPHFSESIDIAGEVLRDLVAARAHAVAWCRDDYGVHVHTRTQRRPREHFEAEEQPHLRPAPGAPYDIPLWATPRVARDHFAQVAKALYTLPTRYIGQTLTARADRALVRSGRRLRPCDRRRR